MRTLNQLRGSILLIVMLSAPNCARLSAPRNEEVHVLVVGVDVSPSRRAADRCREITAAVRRALVSSPDSKLDVLVLSTGGELEPEVVVPWSEFGPSERLFGDDVAADREREEFVGRIGADCRAAVHTSARSPIFQLARRAVEALRARCRELEEEKKSCAPRLALASDLRETLAAAITRRLSGAATAGGRVPLPRLDLKGVPTTVCGFSEVDLPGSRVDVVEVWREVLGPGVTFDPVCLVDARPRDAGDDHAAR